MDDRGITAIAIFALVSIVTLFVLFWSSRSRAPLPSRLIGLGVFVAVVALWFGLLTGLPGRDHIPVPFAYPGLADAALRLGAIMVLGGVVITLLARETVPPLPTTSEAPRHVPPSL